MWRLKCRGLARAVVEPLHDLFNLLTVMLVKSLPLGKYWRTSPTQRVPRVPVETPLPRGIRMRRIEVSLEPAGHLLPSARRNAGRAGTVVLAARR